MGAWGTKTFESDTSLDWIMDFSENDGSIADLNETFDLILSEEEYLDADDGEGGLAAGEIIARAKGNQCENFPEEQFEEFNFQQLKNQFTDTFLEKSIAAIKKVRDDENSEIRELWEETDDYEEWQSNISDLILRIQK